MTPAQIDIVSEIVSQWETNRTAQKLRLLTSFNTLFQEWYAISVQYRSSTIQFWNELLKKFPEYIQNAEEVNRITGSGFNALHFFEPGETMHSYMIAHLLNPRANHGQKNLFLKRFLQLIGIESPDTLNWVVTTEVGRVDIMLKRKNPHAVVLIENKSNWAGDQPNQLYRYWYQNIYAEVKNQPLEYGSNHPEKYRVIYLPPNDSKSPASHSLQKPANWDETLPQTLPLNIETMTFNGFVVDWLEQCIPDIPDSNYRLREYVKQYIELWKN